MSKHTPGPWSAEVDRENDHEINIVSGNRPFVATAWPANHQEDKEQEANARLIAAAPELLEALRIVRDTLPHINGNASSVNSLLKLTGAAIAKATGEQA